MIRKSGNRFSAKIMLKTKRRDHDPIQSNRIMIERHVLYRQERGAQSVKLLARVLS